MLEQLKELVCRANKDLAASGLIIQTFGNVSGVDRAAGIMAIKPSGVAYEDLAPRDIVMVSLGDGTVAEGRLRPSSDAPTHLALYRGFGDIGGVVHTHSLYATAWAQACREIPPYGTTHADFFHGPVPCTRALRGQEIRDDYEAAIGAAIVERFAGLDPAHLPGVLVAGHGPFTWGRTPADAVGNAVALEFVARAASLALQIDPSCRPLQRELLDKHFHRKHGPGAYYGQR